MREGSTGNKKGVCFPSPCTADHKVIEKLDMNHIASRLQIAVSLNKLGPAHVARSSVNYSE